MKTLLPALISLLLVAVCIPYTNFINYSIAIMGLSGLIILHILFVYIVNKKTLCNGYLAAKSSQKIGALGIDSLYCIFWLVVFIQVIDHFPKSLSIVFFYWGMLYFITKDAVFTSIGMSVFGIRYDNTKNTMVKIKIVILNFVTVFPIWLIFFVTHFEGFKQIALLNEVAVIVSGIIICDFLFMFFIDKEQRLSEKILGITTFMITRKDDNTK